MNGARVTGDGASPSITVTRPPSPVTSFEGGRRDLRGDPGGRAAYFEAVLEGIAFVDFEARALRGFATLAVSVVLPSTVMYGLRRS